MEGKKSGGKPCAADIQAMEGLPDKDGVESMETECDQVIGGREYSPKRPFDPERHGDSRDVIQCSLAPNPPPASRLGKNGIIDYKNIVVPDKTGVPDGLVSEQGCDDEDRGGQEKAAARG